MVEESTCGQITSNAVASELLGIEDLRTSPLYWINESKKVLPSGAYAVNDGTNYYGTVGQRYRPVSYLECYNYVKSVTNKKLDVVGAAKSKNGARGSITCDFDVSSNVGKDSIALYLNIINSLDGSIPMGILVTPIRLACMNQYWLAKKTAFIHLKYKHTDYGLSKMMINKSLITKIHDLFSEQIDLSSRLASKKILNPFEVDAIFSLLEAKKIVNSRTLQEADNHMKSTTFNYPITEWEIMNFITNPINQRLRSSCRWSTLSELGRVGRFFANRV